LVDYPSTDIPEALGLNKDKVNRLFLINGNRKDHDPFTWG